MPWAGRSDWRRLGRLSAGIGLLILARSATGQVVDRSGIAGPGRSIGVPVPIAVVDGEAKVDLPAAGPELAARAMVVVSSLARGAGPFAVRLNARPVASTEVEPPALAVDGCREAPAGLIAGIVPISVAPAIGMPPGERSFHLMVRDGDVASASNYRPVRGRLRALGQRVQVYVDEGDIGRVGEAMLRDLVSTFDDRVYPAAERTLGTARDADGDGRFTVLVTGWLARLGGGRLAVDGFVRGADLDPDLGPPFGNRCDMMYLSASLGPGPHLRTVVAHEYTHAVTSTLKAFGPPGDPRRGADEEGWLDEALAHLVEDHHGFSRTNLDYRISAFLSRPERYRLVVDDYYAADLFRSHGNRGSTYLFLRWCVDHFGPGLVPALVRSPRRGVDGLEAATGSTFASLYRRWSVALALDGLLPVREPGPIEGYRTIALRGAVGGWPLAGPRPSVVRAVGAVDAWSASGTSSHFALIEGASPGPVRVEVSGPPEADLQVTAIRLPAGLAAVDLAVRLAPTAGGDPPRVRAELRERAGTAVRLTALAWEPLVPPTDPRDRGRRRGGLDQLGIASAFGTSALPPRGLLASRPIALEGLGNSAGPIVLKAIGTDALGHRVAAWAEIDPSQLPARRDELAADRPSPP